MYIENLKRKQVDELMEKIVRANSDEKIENSLIINLNRDNGYGKVMIQVEHSKGRRLEFYDMDDFTMCKDKVKVEKLTEMANENIYVNYMFLEISNVFEREIAKAMKFKITTDKYERKVAGNVFNPKNFVAIATSQELMEAYSTPTAKKFMKLQQNYNYLFDEE